MPGNFAWHSTTNFKKIPPTIVMRKNGMWRHGGCWVVRRLIFVGRSVWRVKGDEGGRARGFWEQKDDVAATRENRKNTLQLLLRCAKVFSMCAFHMISICYYDWLGSVLCTPLGYMLLFTILSRAQCFIGGDWGDGCLGVCCARGTLGRTMTMGRGQAVYKTLVKRQPMWVSIELGVFRSDMCDAVCLRLFYSINDQNWQRMSVCACVCMYVFKPKICAVDVLGV